MSALSSNDSNAIRAICKIAHELTGVQLNERHWSMVSSRIHKRMSELTLSSLESYLDYFQKNRKSETPKLIALLTTHHTYFFREFSHFEYLQVQALPSLIPAVRARSDKTLRVWVAACSRGQEVYSLAMFLNLHLKNLAPDLKFEIFGSDIDSESVEIARNGVYHRDELKEAPLSLLADHWAKGTGDIAQYVKAKKSLTQPTQWDVINLLDLGKSAGPKGKFDLIFCRNVFIYFNSEQIKQITHQLLARMESHGFFFIGISESLSSLGLPVSSPGPSVYTHRVVEKAKPATKETKKAQPTITTPAPVKDVPIRLVCVDDSPTILALLKQIAAKDPLVQIVGTAKNGIEAAKAISELKPDVVTLDIHMPEQNGLDYLKVNYKKGHPPVVMVTSVSRDDSDLAAKALDLGAADYVEKPALSNLTEKTEEILNKIHCAAMAHRMHLSTSTRLDHAFQKKQNVTELEKKLRIAILPLSKRDQLKAILKELQGPQPPWVVLVEGAKDALSGIVKALQKEFPSGVHHSEGIPKQLKPGEIWVLDFNSNIEELAKNFSQSLRVSIMVFGKVTQAGSQKILQFKDAQLLLEDLGNGKASSHLMDVASDVVPATSFGYLSHEFFSHAESAKKKAA